MDFPTAHERIPISLAMTCQEAPEAVSSVSKMAYQTLQQEYLQIPVVTRAYTTACVLTTAAVVRPTRNEPSRTEPSRSVSQSGLCWFLLSSRCFCCRSECELLIQEVSFTFNVVPS